MKMDVSGDETFRVVCKVLILHTQKSHKQCSQLATHSVVSYTHSIVLLTLVLFYKDTVVLIGSRDEKTGATSEILNLGR